VGFTDQLMVVIFHFVGIFNQEVQIGRPAIAVKDAFQIIAARSTG
jgi:hypothetical protein